MITFKAIFEIGLTELDVWREIQYRKQYGSYLFNIFNECSTDELEVLFNQTRGYDMEEIKRGYCICNSGIGATHVEKLDDLNVYKSDVEASLQAEKDGITFIRDIRVDESHPLWDMYIDTPENRQVLAQYGLL